MEVKVSVIIPVYNAEKYLDDCISSLINQTLNECEFIFIDDGSKDNSIKIIQRYLKIDTRIKLIHQENQGVSAARNKGLDYSNGKFVCFVDADDYINKFLLEKIYDIAIDNDLDMVIYNYNSELDGHKVKSKIDLPVNKKLDRLYIENNILVKFIKDDELNSVWNKLYKNILIKEGNINFPNCMAIGEDRIFNINYLSRINNLMYIDYIGYYYREVKDSATRNILKHDYFKYEVDIFNSDVLNNVLNLDFMQINKLKVKRLIDKVISYVYLYLKPNKTISFKYRYRYIRAMVNNPQVRDSINIYKKEYYNEKSRYEKCVIRMIKKRNVIGLYILTIYSWIRNKV